MVHEMEDRSVNTAYAYKKRQPQEWVKIPESQLQKIIRQINLETVIMAHVILVFNSKNALIFIAVILEVKQHIQSLVLITCNFFFFFRQSTHIPNQHTHLMICFCPLISNLFLSLCPQSRLITISPLHPFLLLKNLPVVFATIVLETEPTLVFSVS